MIPGNERIHYLINTYVSKTASPEEEAELMEWVQEAEEDSALKTYMLGLWENHHSGQQFPGVDWEQIYARALSDEEVQVKKLPVLSRSIRNRRWISYAAAILLLMIGISTILYINRSQKAVEGTVSEQDLKNINIPPGRDGAILTLADGRQVLLDTIGNGVIASQNGTEVSLKGGQLLYDAKNAGEITYNIMTTPKGRQFQLRLPDGTDVWLNAASSIKFPTAFAGKTREVEITGEVYLEVAKNARQPFLVHTRNSTVRVLGTKFNVNAYDDEASVKTTLLEGSVNVMRKGATSDTKPLILEPGQQALINAREIRLAPDVNTDQELAWRSGQFSFDNADLRTVMRELERWYDIDVKYENYIPGERFSGKMYRNLNLSDLLEVLQKMGAKFSVQGRTVIVSN